MDINVLSASLSSIVELSRLVVDERDRQKALAIQVDLTNKVAETQSQLLEVLGTVIDQQRLIPVLEQRIRDMEAAKAEQARYRLTKVGSYGEFFAYALRSPAELGESVGEPPHFLCQPCFDTGKKVVLVGNGSGYWGCPVCKHGAQTTSDGGSGITVFSSGGDRFSGF